MKKDYQFITVVVRQKLPEDMTLHECLAYIQGLEAGLKEMLKIQGSELISITPTKYEEPR